MTCPTKPIPVPNGNLYPKGRKQAPGHLLTRRAPPYTEKQNLFYAEIPPIFRAMNSNPEQLELLGSLSPELFWDVDPKQIDPNAHRDFLIVRCVERGRSEDVRKIRDFYGPDQIKRAVVNAPALGRKTIAFFAHQFDLPPDSFRAFQRFRNWES
ncbi:MAG: DUF6922 domain-containing protein [Opitutales bacterium]